jgi:hypothetical protein
MRRINENAAFGGVFLLLLFLFLVGLVFELMALLAKQILFCLSYPSSPLCSGYFGGWILKTICLG